MISWDGELFIGNFFKVQMLSFPENKLELLTCELADNLSEIQMILLNEN